MSDTAIQVTVTITLPASNVWQYRFFNAMQNIGASIMTNPQFNEGRGETTDYAYEYTMKGIEQ